MAMRLNRAAIRKGIRRPDGIYRRMARCMRACALLRHGVDPVAGRREGRPSPAERRAVSPVGFPAESTHRLS